MSKDVAAYGTLGGLAYVAPWEKVSAYKNQVRAEEKAIYATNQNKLAKIADMEKEQYTALKAYDQALEPYYEGLHQEFGSVIQQYGDPQASFEGTHALKQIERKFLNNDIYNNAQLTKASYAQLQHAYASRSISQEDYDAELAKFKAISGEGGDPTKVYEFKAPDYRTDEEIIKATMGNYEQTNQDNSTLTKTIHGYSESQFIKGFEMIMLDKSVNKQFSLRTDQRMRNEKGNEAIDALDEKSYTELFRATALAQMRKQYPLNVTKHAPPGGSGNGNGQPRVAQSVRDMQTGSYSPTALANYYELNKDGSIVDLNSLSTQDSRTSIINFKGKALPQSVEANLDAGDMRGKVRIPVVHYASGIHERTEQYYRKVAGTEGTVKPVPQEVDETTFERIGAIFGYTTAEVQQIKDKLTNGYYAGKMGESLTINGKLIALPNQGNNDTNKSKNYSTGFPLIAFAYESMDLLGTFLPNGISKGVLGGVDDILHGDTDRRSIDITTIMPMMLNEKTATKRNAEAANNQETQSMAVNQMNSIRASQMVTLSSTGSAVGKTIIGGETAVTAFLNQNTNEIYDMNRDEASLAEMSGSDKWKNQLNEYVLKSFSNLSDKNIQKAVEGGRDASEAADAVFTDVAQAKQFLANMFGSHHANQLTNTSSKMKSALYRWFNTESNGSSYNSLYQNLKVQVDTELKPGGKYDKVMQTAQYNQAMNELSRESKEYNAMEQSEQVALINKRMQENLKKKPMSKVEYYNNLATTIDPATDEPYISAEDYSMLILGEALNKTLK